MLTGSVLGRHIVQSILYCFCFTLTVSLLAVVAADFINRATLLGDRREFIVLPVDALCV